MGLRKTEKKLEMEMAIDQERTRIMKLAGELVDDCLMRSGPGDLLDEDRDLFERAAERLLARAQQGFFKVASAALIIHSSQHDNGGKDDAKPL